MNSTLLGNEPNLVGLWHPEDSLEGNLIDRTTNGNNSEYVTAANKFGKHSFTPSFKVGEKDVISIFQGKKMVFPSLKHLNLIFVSRSDRYGVYVYDENGNELENLDMGPNITANKIAVNGITGELWASGYRDVSSGRMRL